MKKECNTCRKFKWLNEYYTDVTSPDHKRARCIECDSKVVDDWFVAFNGNVYGIGLRGRLKKCLRFVNNELEKQCSSCEGWFKKEGFYPSTTPNAAAALEHRCITCSKKYVTKWNKNNPDKHSTNQRNSYRNRSLYQRNYNLKRYHGITHEEYIKILESQGGVCGNCGTSDPGSYGKYFNLDHDHETGKNRDLICSNCNWGFGNFKDSIELLQKAIKYLRRHGKNG